MVYFHVRSDVCPFWWAKRRVEVFPNISNIWGFLHIHTTKLSTKLSTDDSLDLDYLSRCHQIWQAGKSWPCLMTRGYCQQCPILMSKETLNNLHVHQYTQAKSRVYLTSLHLWTIPWESNWISSYKHGFWNGWIPTNFTCKQRVSQSTFNEWGLSNHW